MSSTEETIVYYNDMVDGDYHNDYKTLGIKINMNKCYNNYLLSK